MDFGGDWHKLVEYIKALEARVAALESMFAQVGDVSSTAAAFERDLTADKPKPRAKR